MSSAQEHQEAAAHHEEEAASAIRAVDPGVDYSQPDVLAAVAAFAQAHATLALSHRLAIANQIARGGS